MGGYGRPKLEYFDGSITRYARVSSMSKFLMNKLVKKPYVAREGEQYLQPVSKHIMNKIKSKLARTKQEVA